jgi:hypothetical protein
MRDEPTEPGTGEPIGTAGGEFGVREAQFGVPGQEFGVREAQFGVSGEEFGVPEAEFGVPEAEEFVDGLPVLAEVHPIDPLPSVAGLPTVQAAAAAITGFVAGAATLAMMRRRHARRLARGARAFDVLPMAGTRTYIVHVQRIGRLEE